MLLLNGKPLIENKNRNMEIQKLISEVKQDEPRLYINPDKGKIKRFLSNGRKERTPDKGVMLENTILTEKGYEKWAWTSGSPKAMKNEPGMYTVSDKRMWIGTDLYVDPNKDPEFACFLEFFSISVRKGDLVRFIEKDEDEKQVRKIAEDVEVKALITGRTSPISKEMKESEAYLRTIAASWGVVNAESLSLDKIKLQLLAKVNESESRKKTTKRGYTEFINDVITISNCDLYGDTRVERRAKIQKALDTKKDGHNIIEFNQEKMAYIFTPINKEFIRIKASEKETRIDKLIKYFESNTEDWNLVAYELGEDVHSNLLTVEDVENEKSHTRLKRWAKDQNLKVLDIGETSIRLKEILIEKLQQ